MSSRILTQSQGADCACSRYWAVKHCQTQVKRTGNLYANRSLGSTHGWDAAPSKMETWKAWDNQHGWILSETSWMFHVKGESGERKKNAHTIHFQHYNHFRHWWLQLEPTTGEGEAFQGKGGKATHSNSTLHLLGCGTRCGWRWLWGATLSGTAWRSKPVTDRLSRTHSLCTPPPSSALTLPVKLCYWVMGPDKLPGQDRHGTVSIKVMKWESFVQIKRPQKAKENLILQSAVSLSQTSFSRPHKEPGPGLSPHFPIPGVSHLVNTAGERRDSQAYYCLSAWVAREAGPLKKHSESSQGGGESLVLTQVDFSRGAWASGRSFQRSGW